jgi:hypothetical protein
VQIIGLNFSLYSSSNNSQKVCLRVEFDVLKVKRDLDRWICNQTFAFISLNECDRFLLPNLMSCSSNIYFEEQALTKTQSLYFFKQLHFVINNINFMNIKRNSTQLFAQRAIKGLRRGFDQYVSYIVGVSFIGGANRSTRRKPPTCRKLLTNFIT